jgi:hypothetical protein
MFIPGDNAVDRKLAPFWTATTFGAAVVEGVTVSVIGRLSVIAPAAAIETEPEYEPAVKPAGLIDTVTLDGVVPDVGVTDSQLPLELCADALKVTALPPAIDTAKVCDSGLESPI